MYLKAYLAEYYWNPRTKPLPEKTILHNAKIILFTIYQCIYFIGISEKTRIDRNGDSFYLQLYIK